MDIVDRCYRDVKGNSDLSRLLDLAEGNGSEEKY